MPLSPFLRRLRGVASTALFWAIAWLPFGVALVTLWLGPRRSEAPPAFSWRSLATAVLVWCTWGAISGGVFAVALAVAERKRSLADLSMLRTTLWGGFGSGSAPAVVMTVAYFRTGPRVILPYVLFVAATASLGAAMAAGSLALARRAPSASDSTTLSVPTA